VARLIYDAAFLSRYKDVVVNFVAFLSAAQVEEELANQ